MKPSSGSAAAAALRGLLPGALVRRLDRELPAFLSVLRALSEAAVDEDAAPEHETQRQMISGGYLSWFRQLTYTY